jgi:diadenosine tetraphosphate (Ap4A) HIT family hydrolase
MTTLHPQLQKDCLIVGRFKLCHLLLMNDANYPWLILVPDRDNITEIYQLAEEDQAQLIHESSLVAKMLSEHFNADKINIAALGNVVPQLHIHHIARYRHDAAWPKPVWGQVPSQPYSEEAQMNVLDKLRAALKEGFGFAWNQ